MGDDKLDDMMLDDLFATAAREMEEAVSSDLLARVMADALAVQAEQQQQPEPEKAPKLTMFQVVVKVLGGWQSMGGLAAATVAGVWIGVAAGPEMMQSDWAGSLLTTNAESYLSDLDNSYAFVLD